MDNCVPNSFVALEKKFLAAGGGCNSDGMAWRRYHIPITEEWITLGDSCGHDLRQADVITFAMPPIVATQFPTSVSLVAAPVAKGLHIKTAIAADYLEQDTITVHQRPELVYPLHHKPNGLPYGAFVDDKLVRERGLRVVSHFELFPYTDEKAMELLSTQWKHHNPVNWYWTTVEKCYTLMSVERIHHGIPVWASNDVDPSDNCDLNLRLTATTVARNISQSSKLYLELESFSRKLWLPLNNHWHLTRTTTQFTISTLNLKISVCLRFR